MGWCIHNIHWVADRIVTKIPRLFLNRPVELQIGLKSVIGKYGVKLSSWIGSSFWGTTSTVWTNTTSRRGTLFLRRMTRLRTWRRRSSSSSTEGPWTQGPTTKGGTTGWSRARPRGSSNWTTATWFRTTWGNPRSTRLTTWKWFQRKQWTSIQTILKLKRKIWIWNYSQSINTK